MTQDQLNELTRDMLREMSMLLHLACGKELRLSEKPGVATCAKAFLAQAALMGREGEK